MEKKLLQYGLLSISFLASVASYAAERVNLMQEPLPQLKSYIETSRTLDATQTLHVRLQQMYLGYPVYGADAVMHIPHASNKKMMLDTARVNQKIVMNGTFYKNINADLANKSNLSFAQSAGQQVLDKAIYQYQHQIGMKVPVQQSKKQLLVYVDENNKAHWAYKVTFYVPALKSNSIPSRPVYIMDATTFQIYKTWDNIQTTAVIGGGYGGNLKIGRLIYDGLPNHLAALDVMRDDKSQICKLETDQVRVSNQNTGKEIDFKCKKTSATHNQLYWHNMSDSVNGGYSPANDALFGGEMVKKMYQDWYGISVLQYPSGQPMLLDMYVHDKEEGDNAHWDAELNMMVFGDGKTLFYPLTSLGITAHEVSHGFTQQHSDLVYDGQSGAMNEAFSDMAAQAAEMYVYGKNSWQIGAEVVKRGDKALRYMDMPSKDCYGREPGVLCSIDNADQYYPGLNVHHGSGVYNRFFYLLSTSQDWDVRKAFDVMVRANFYWTSTTNFNSGACDVLQAATDLHRDVSAVKAAFDIVKVDYTDRGRCRVLR